MNTQLETLEARLIRDAAEEKARREAEEKRRMDILLDAFRS